jgi:hypothetical protein
MMHYFSIILMFLGVFAESRLRLRRRSALISPKRGWATIKWANNPLGSVSQFPARSVCGLDMALITVA